MRKIVSACIVATIATCTTIPSFGGFAENSKETMMSDSVQIEQSGKKSTITINDLERIKGEILTYLKEREPNKLDEGLINALQNSTPKISPDNTAHIGAWRLIVQGQSLFLQCPVKLHQNYRLYYEAVLEIKDGYWKVKWVKSVMIKREGL